MQKRGSLHKFLEFHIKTFSKGWWDVMTVMDFQCLFPYVPAERLSSSPLPLSILLETPMGSMPDAKEKVRLPRLPWDSWDQVKAIEGRFYRSKSHAACTQNLLSLGAPCHQGEPIQVPMVKKIFATVTMIEPSICHPFKLPAMTSTKGSKPRFIPAITFHLNTEKEEYWDRGCRNIAEWPSGSWEKDAAHHKIQTYKHHIHTADGQINQTLQPEWKKPPIPQVSKLAVAHLSVMCFRVWFILSIGKCVSMQVRFEIWGGWGS